MQTERRDNSARVLVIMVLLFLTVSLVVGLMIAVTWWLESRFGPNAALIVWGLLIGVIVFGVGFARARSLFIGTLHANASQIEHIATAMNATAKTQTAYINMQRDEQRHALKQDERIEREALRLGRAMSRSLATAQTDDVSQFWRDADVEAQARKDGVDFAHWQDFES